MDKESPRRKFRKETLWKAGLDEILELNNNRENDRTILENNLKEYFSQKDVLRLLYVEEWRSEREEQVLAELEKLTKPSGKSRNYRKSSPLHGVIAKRFEIFMELKKKLSEAREKFSKSFQSNLLQLGN